MNDVVDCDWKLEYKEDLDSLYKMQVELMRTTEMLHTLLVIDNCVPTSGKKLLNRLVTYCKIGFNCEWFDQSSVNSNYEEFVRITEQNCDENFDAMTFNHYVSTHQPLFSLLFIHFPFALQDVESFINDLESYNGHAICCLPLRKALKKVNSLFCKQVEGDNETLEESDDDTLGESDDDSNDDLNDDDETVC